MLIDKSYQLWKVASKDKNRQTLVHISVTHWPFGPDFFIEPSHGVKFHGVKGSFFRKDREGMPCSCVDCKHAHAKNRQDPDSPFNIADIVLFTDVRGHTERVGVIFSTGPVTSTIMIPNASGYTTLNRHNGDIQLLWSEKGVDTPAVEVEKEKMISDKSLEAIMNAHYGVAVATNGWVLAVVPVEIESSEDIGMFNSKILWDAHKAHGRSTVPVFLRFGKHSNGHEYVKLSNGNLLPRYRDLEEVTTSYPGWQDIVPARRLKAGEGDHGIMTFDPRQFAVLADAVGVKGHTGYMRLAFSSTVWASPYILEQIGNLGDHYKPPFGLIMPIHDGPAEDHYKVKPFHVDGEEE